MRDINNILQYIEKYLSDESNWHMVNVDRGGFNIPPMSVLQNNKQGLYFIKTNIDKNEFSLLPNKPYDKEHYNLKERFKNPVYGSIGYNYNEDKDGFYIVYNGENGNVRNRIQAHMKGYEGTGCLAIQKYGNLVKSNTWKIAWIHIDDIVLKFEDDFHEIKNIKKDNKKSKEFRLLLENGWRYRNIWPIFSKR